MDIRRILDERSLKHSSKAALICNDNATTFSQLREDVYKLAQGLLGLGIKNSDKLAIFLPNGAEYVQSYLACFSIGAVAVPLDFMFKNDEIISCLSHSEAKVLIAQNNSDVDLAMIMNNVSTLEIIILVSEENPGAEGIYSFEKLIAEASPKVPEVDIKDADPALIMYTSGTTGRPKGILLNYKHLEGSPAAMKHFVDLSEHDIKLCAIPLSHIAGLIYIQNCILFGITLIIMPRFNPLEFLRNIQKHKVTCFHIVPAMYMAILTMKQIDQFDLSSLRWMVVFGAPSSPETLARFRKYCPNAQLLNGWGMTETCPPNVVTPLGCENIASVGKPAPHCEIRVIDELGREVQQGEVGELTISGWIIMDSYYKDPELTAQTIKDGWLLTGDLARFDADGFLYIVGRKKEMIKVGGQIVFAPEVEAALFKHEHVAEVAVIGIKDDLRGERVKAFVVLKEGACLASEDLRYFAREHLAHFKVPQEIELRSELPKNRAGKIDKGLLQEEQKV